MSDGFSDNPYLHNARPRPARQPKPGIEVWRLTDATTGKIHSCELRDNTRTGGGWDLQVFVDGELSFSRWCESEAQARALAGFAEQDSRRCGG